MKDCWFQRKYFAEKALVLSVVWSVPTTEQQSQSWVMALELDFGDRKSSKRVVGIDPMHCLLSSLNILGDEIAVRFLSKRTDSLGPSLNVARCVLYGSGLHGSEDNFYAGAGSCEQLADQLADVDGISAAALEFLRSYSGAVLSRCLEVSGEFILHACRQPTRVSGAWRSEGIIWSDAGGLQEICSIGIDPLQALLGTLQSQCVFLGQLGVLEESGVRLDRDYFPGTGALIMALPSS